MVKYARNLVVAFDPKKTFKEEETMDKLEELKNEAEFLSRNIVTIWHDYDYNEKTSEIEKRVPKIEIRVNGVKVIFEKIYADKNAEKCNGKEEYVREYEIQYNGHTYIFRIRVNVVNGIVSKFSLKVFTLEKAELITLLEEVL